MRLHLWCCFWVDQGSCHQWHNPQVLQPLTPSDNTGRCLTGRPWCSTPAKWQTCSLCQQCPHQNWMPIHKHRERDASCCLWSREISTLTSMGGPSQLNQTTSHLNPSSWKNLADTPAWLQCMMLCLQGYDFTIHYCLGKETVIPDTLSWFQSLARPWPPIGYHYPSCLHNARLQRSLPTSLHQWSRNVSSCQPHHGWPKDIKEIPCPLCPYWQHKETLIVKDGLVLWGEALIIPPAKRERVLHQLHQFQSRNNEVSSGLA